MTTKQKLGKIWTDSVAYVMLLVGAGLSILFNVVNTLAARGVLVDWVDWVVAIGAPSLVVGMVEMFVNDRWTGQPWYMQVLRWLGTLAIGGVAMRMSWTHGHALLLSRGQTSDVAVLFPLAIDFLAIMATALILSGRGHRGVSSVQAEPMGTVQDTPVDSVQAEPMTYATEADVQESEAAFRGDLSNRVDIPLDEVTWTAPADVPTFGVQNVPDTLPSWMDGLADRTTGGGYVQAAPLPQRPPVVPGREGAGRLGDAERAEIRELTAVGREHGMYLVGEIRELLAAWYGVSVKTIQRAEMSQ